MSLWDQTDAEIGAFVRRIAAIMRQHKNGLPVSDLAVCTASCIFLAQTVLDANATYFRNIAYGIEIKDRGNIGDWELVIRKVDPWRRRFGKTIGWIHNIGRRTPSMNKEESATIPNPLQTGIKDVS